jgi:hypothetical protein
VSVHKTYIGSELAMEIYKGKSIVDDYFDLTEDDGTDSDLTIYNLIVLEIFAKRGGTLIDTFNNNSGLTIEGNRVTWNASKSRMDLYLKGFVYYHHMYGVIASGSNAGQQNVLFFGPSIII